MAKAKRGHVLKELLETERVYVSELCSILKVSLRRRFWQSKGILRKYDFHDLLLN